MPKLGELLVAAKIVTAAQVDTALRAQVVWGGRLGTNLVELGAIDLDTLARALGRQRGMLAALARHFDNADRQIQDALPAELAARWRCVPLCGLSNATIAVASIDPLDANACAAIARELDIPPARLVVSIAPELRVYYHLERVYQIQRDSRYQRARGPTKTPFPELEIRRLGETSEAELAIPIEVDEPEPEARDSAVELLEIPLGEADVIEEAVPAPPQRPRSESGRERRTYAKTLADAVDSDLDARALGRIALRKVAVETTDIPRVVEHDETTAASLADATRAIRRAPNRERVAELVLEAIDRFAPACEAAIVLVVRGDVAFGWRHFARGAVAAPEIAVPLGSPGVVPTVFATSAVARKPSGDLGAIDRLLLQALGGAGDLVVAPIAIAGQVMCMIAAATAPGATSAEIEAIASAAGVAFARLMRDASR